MTETDLFAAFERIHPSHRDLQVVRPKGKTHWLYVKTKPEEERGEQTLVHFERGHGSADALAEFLIAAMAFAREQYVKDVPGLGSSDGDLMVPADPTIARASRFRIEIETRTFQMCGVVSVDVSGLTQAAGWASTVEKLEQLGIRVTEIPESDRGWLRTELDSLNR